MNKILDMYEPLIKTYPIHANITSILSTHKYFYEWLYNNHIQLFCTTYNSNGSQDTYLDTYKPLTRVFNPFFETQFIKKDIIFKNKIDICEFIINSIDLGYYIFLSIDVFFISLYQKSEHSGHDIFVFGYDKNKKIFHVADFFNGHYKKETVSFDSLQQAIASPFSDDNELKGIQLLKVPENKYDSVYCFDINYVKDLLRDYLYERDTSNRYRAFEGPLPGSDDRTWGLEVYSSLIRAINQIKISPVTLRSLHALYEHKRLMTMRVNYLYSNKFIESSSKLIGFFEQIENESLLIRNLFIKYSLNDNFERANLTARLTEVRNLEENCLSVLIDSFYKEL